MDFIKKNETKKDDPDFKLDNYFTFNIALLKLLSMWPLKGTGKKVIPTILFVFYAFFMHFSVLHMIYVLIMDTYYQWTGELAAVAFKIANVIAYLCTTCKLFFFHIRMRQLTTFLRKLNDNVRVRSAVGLDFVTLENSYRMGRKYCILWTTIVMAGCQHLTIYPLLVQERIMPIASSYPFDTVPFPTYEILLLWQAICQAILGLSYCALGLYYMCVILMLCGQYDILFCSLKNLYNTARLDKGVTPLVLRQMMEEHDKEQPEANEYYTATPMKEDLTLYPNGFKAIVPQNKKDNLVRKERARQQILSFNLKSVSQYLNNNTNISSNTVIKKNDSYLTELDYYLNKAITDCVCHHLWITECCIEFKNLLSPMLFIKALQISSFLGVCAYSASGSGQDRIQIFNIVEYLFLSTSDLFIFCYFGHQLYSQSERVRLALLRAPWHLFGGSVRRSMSIILQAASTPIILTGGGFYSMDLAQFRSLLSASFSYFTLLRNMQE